MPELPEVETIKRGLNRQIVGKKIKSLWTDHPKMLEIVDPPSTKTPITPKKLQARIKNTIITRVLRRAKNLLIEISNANPSKTRALAQTLWVHLKMTGHLLYKPQNPAPRQKKAFTRDKYNRYIHLILHFTDHSRLAFSDLRKFGRLRLIPAPAAKITNNPARFGLGPLGPEPLKSGFTPQNLAQLLKNSKKPLKTLLMDQKIISGIGNIYASEILFQAGLSPKIKAANLNPAQIKKLHSSIKDILKRAVNLRGTSISDYRDSSGQKGCFGRSLAVYKRAGKRCKKCANIIKSIKQGQRSTFYCAYCQK
ncbi:MAG: bifunctional DNA-formamidopyrimidine glycosylase/DNA-(apurinic or apyrimidinic site) lyase [Patescibacteria group bacterium]|nr:bifunctional DNA-formamidopyrimidine glycosylase/DNA-(apurinic or apyrimidinic site) lyase [Patescibacteria group bacterium]